MIKLAHKSDIPPGEAKTVLVGERMIAIFNLGDAIHAIADACPHRGASLSLGAVDGCKVICPWHGWEFDIPTGRLAMSPGVDSYAVEVRGDEIWIDVE